MNRVSLAIKQSRTSAGFTLIEIMITLTIVGILSAIAIPSYFEYVKRANRAEAKAQLMEAVQYMQRFYSLHNAYDVQRDGRTQARLPDSLTRSPRSGAARYTIRLASKTSTSYVLEAAPIGQDECGIFRIDNVGRCSIDTKAVHPANRALSAESCWR